MPRAKKIDAAPPAGPRPTAKSPRQVVAQTPSVPHELIAIRAFELFLCSGGAHGADLDHWLTAERELAARHASERPLRRPAGRRLKGGAGRAAVPGDEGKA